nr:hypothetical protein [Tanacetum cinerariifolium]
GEGSGTPTEPHYTPSSVAQTPSHTTQPTSSLPPVSPTSILTIDAQVARELEEQQEIEDKRMAEQIARDAEVARIHAEEELQSMIDGLDRNN